MTMSTSEPRSSRLPVVEFVAMLAMMFALTAFSIDAMLPAMPTIAAELSPDAPNRAQLIITFFVLGMGIGTFVTGPLSDSLGRRTVILGGAFLYCIGAALAWAAPTLELMLAARLFQGLGVAGPRIAGIALVRDLYSGREMARLVSFVMTIFSLVPAIAPLAGSWIISLYGWRAIFMAFILFAVITMSWFMARQGETLAPERRRPLRIAPLIEAAREVLTNRLVVTVTAAQTLAFGCLFATLSSTQQVFDQTFGRAESFPKWFALIALLAGTGSIVNGRLVPHLGMRRLASGMFAFQAVNSAIVMTLFALNLVPSSIAFWLYLYWTISVFFMIGLTIGNLNALAMEPMGHIAGMAASLVAAMATVMSVVVAIPIGLAFDGTPVPMMAGVFICTALARLLMVLVPDRPA